VDRRQYTRLNITLRFEYHAQLQGAADLLTDQAILKNISMNGLLFMSEATPILKPGDVAEFIFKFQHSNSNPFFTNEIRATGKVKRVEAPLAGSPLFGIVVEFLSGPVFMPAD
jgi:c-di-GMP-binding flagellar brake protein YcgR